MIAVDKEGLHAYNAYTLKPINKIIRIAGEKVTDLVFSDLDKCFAICGSKGRISRWELPSFNEIVVERDEE